MKRWLLLATLALAAMAVAATGPLMSNTDYGRFPVASNGRATDEIDVDTLTQFNFESGLQGWEVQNLTEFTQYWHPERRSPMGGTGLSWACNDTITWPVNGGYTNHILMYMVSPAVNLTTAQAPILTFNVNIRCEDPAGATAPYNGWDTGNVWYSTDGGTTWTPLPLTTAGGATGYLYNFTSSYAFGSEFGMGANIPGWGGNSGGWQTVTFPIPTAMRVANFKIRFAFCSDPAYCSSDDPTMFGMKVDNIAIQDRSTYILRNDAEANQTPAAFTFGSANVTSTNVWSRVQQTTAGHSTPNCMRIAEDSTMEFRSAIASPKVFLPRNFTYWWEYNVWCDFRDATSPGGTTLEDYYRWEIRSNHPDSDWVYQHHDYNRTGAGGDGWARYVPGTPFGTSANIQMDISNWVGDSIRMRCVAIGDSGNDNGTGAGLFVDDWAVLYTNQPNNDLGTESLLVPYPNTVGYTTKGYVTVKNPGRNDQTAPILRWRRVGTGGGTSSISLGTIVSGGDTTVLLRTSTAGQGALGWTPTSAGTFAVDAYTVLAGDENPANDTTNFYNATLTRTDSVTVAPQGTYELGYDVRQIQYRFTFAVGSGPMVKFTPAADSIPRGQFANWTLSTVRAQWNGNVTAGNPRTITMKIYGDNAGAVGALLHTQVVTVTNADVLPAIQTITLSSPLEINGDFYIFFERTGTADDLPNIIGHDNQDAWIPGHHFTYDGTTRTVATNGYRIHAILTPSTSVREVSGDVPNTFSLYPAYPNPFNPSTEIKFTVPKLSHVELAVYNTIGQKVVTLVNSPVVAGTHVATFDGSKLSSGVYLVKMNAGSFTSTSKVVLVK